jgi:hypothetical protein
MRQRSLIPCVLAGLLVGFPFASAMADHDVEVDIQCPTEQASSTTTTVTIIYENYSCSAVPIRTMSSIVGNSNQTLGGIGVFGPFVIDDRVIAAGSGVAYCGCGAGQCMCSANSCSTDVDCPECRAQTPYVLNVERTAEPAIPESLDGTVATYLFISEAGVGTEETDTEISECFVEVL